MIEVTCIRGTGNKELPDIKDDLIPNDHIAVCRGRDEINKNYYKKHRKSISTPYKKDVYNGSIIGVYDSNLSIADKYEVQTMNLVMNKDGAWTTLHIEKFTDEVNYNTI